MRNMDLKVEKTVDHWRGKTFLSIIMKKIYSIKSEERQ
jgi:hypothetical protein